MRTKSVNLLVDVFIDERKNLLVSAALFLQQFFYLRKELCAVVPLLVF